MPLTLFERVVCERWVGDWTELQHIDPPAPSSLTALFLVLLGCTTGGLGDQPLLRHGSHSSIFSPTYLNFLSPGLYNNLTSTYFTLNSTRHNSHSIQPVDSQGYPPISSTGCTCYLHRCISHLTARLGRRLIYNDSKIRWSLSVNQI